MYKLHNNSTSGQKADNIYLKYCEKLSGKAKEYINGETLIDLEETTEDIEEILKNMDGEQKKEFIQSVEVEKLTLLNAWKKLNRQHFARIVWLSVKVWGGRFTPKEEILPSFIGNKQEDEIIKRDEELKKIARRIIGI